MRSLVNTCKKHADNAAESWKNCLQTAATAHSALSRLSNEAVQAATHARNASRATIITLLATAAVNIGIATAIFCFL